MQVPTSDTPQDLWDHFVTALDELLAHRDLNQDFALSDTQIQRLVDYLEANQLLLECLNVAVVSDRAAIEARILQPPEG